MQGNDQWAGFALVVVFGYVHREPAGHAAHSDDDAFFIPCEIDRRDDLVRAVLDGRRGLFGDTDRAR